MAAEVASSSWFWVRDVATVITLGLSVINMLLVLKDRSAKRWQLWTNEWNERLHTQTQMHEMLMLKLTAAEIAIAILQDRMNVFWKGVAYNAAMTLHSPHTPEFDALLERFRDGVLTTADVPQLKTHLQDILAEPGASRLRKKVAREALLVLYMQYEVTQVRDGLDFRTLFSDRDGPPEDRAHGAGG